MALRAYFMMLGRADAGLLVQLAGCCMRFNLVASMLACRHMQMDATPNGWAGGEML